VELEERQVRIEITGDSRQRRERCASIAGRSDHE